MRDKYRQQLEKKYKSKIAVNIKLSRKMVSFQANKGLPFFRWFKYKEGFSAPLVNYLIDQAPGHRRNAILDPFAGSGAALFSAREKGLNSLGIELLPVGVFVIKNRLNSEKINIDDFVKASKQIQGVNFQEFENGGKFKFNHLNITRGAFPEESEKCINGFLNYCEEKVESQSVKELLLFSLFSILESISYTRKDGQYLRWDERAHKPGNKTRFNKGQIPTFKEAIVKKLQEMTFDISIMTRENGDKADPILFEDSILYKLPELEDDSIDLVITSPPYCNRYDYTRTYALELAFLGVNDEKLKELRQTLLTSTVENREKIEQMRFFYRKKKKEIEFDKIYSAYDSEKALKEIISILKDLRDEKKLNNPNIVRMVNNYFLEMCIVIFEMYRVLKKDGIVFMVNDNVRYAGETIPVDLILSEFAESAGFNIDKIWILSNGKGNSSQQMGNHGREALRKCLYVWKK